MTSFLEELVGLKVIKAEIVCDYLQVFFEGLTCLSVFNKNRITNSDGQPESALALVGTALSAVHQDEMVILLKFSNALELSVDMTYDGYLGPEAMQLTRPAMPTVIWRPDG